MSLAPYRGSNQRRWRVEVNFGQADAPELAALPA
jgi:hypothetical protein